MKRYNSLKQVKADIDSGNLNCVSLVEYYLNNIEQKKHLNAFLEVFGDEAKERAAEIDTKIKNGNAGKLAGMVIAIKDNICYKGHKVSASSKILEGFESLYSSTAVERLLAEDAIIIGRTNCDEFAMGASNENSAYGVVLNDLDNTKVPGGSSGGSAVAVQADLCLASLGSDTGGSIRQPSSFTGTYGFKPTYGRISRHGLIAFSSSLDQIGPFARSVEDVALVTEVIAGKDDFDSTVSSKPVDTYSELAEPSRKYKIAYIKDCIEREGIDPEIVEQLKANIEKLRAEGHTVEAVDFPYLDYMVPCYSVITTAEASSNLSRFSGLHYGHRSEKAEDLESTFKKSRTEGFGKEVKRRIMLGTFVLTSDYSEEYFNKAQKVRRVIYDKSVEIFNNYDFILTPTTPTTAFELGEKSADPVAMYLADIFTVQANLGGFPALSMPLGKHSNGLPFGIQLMANKFEEKELLAFSNYFASMQ